MHFRYKWSPKLVEDSSESSKRRKLKELRKTFGFPELTHATKMSLRSAGKADSPKRCNEAFKTKTTRALRIIQAFSEAISCSLMMTELSKHVGVF